MQEDLTQQTPVMEQRESYSFLANVAALKGAISLQLGRDYEVRHATSAEIAEIKEDLKRVLGTLSTWTPCWEFWECERPVPSQQDRWGGAEPKLLPEAEWRYFVIAFRGPKSPMPQDVHADPDVNLNYAVDLAPVELEIAYTTLYCTDPKYADHPVASRYYPNRLFQVFSRAREQLFYRPRDDRKFFVEIGTADVAEIAEIHALLEGHGSQLIKEKKLLDQLGSLKGLPDESPLRFLGYFALLESLLTHQPEPTDPYDSITRQIVNKLNLLDHRLPRPIDYGQFGNVPPETVWKKMYKCRSLVAHGGEPDFSKDLHVLRSQEDSLKLIKDTTKAVIVQALREPQLVADLRQC